VEIYKGLNDNLKSLASGQEDFTLICNMLMKLQNEEASTYAIGDLIHVVDERNQEGTPYEFYGINKDKTFMQTVATTNGLDAKNYKILCKDRFVFSGMQTGRDECIRIGCFEESTPVLVSPAYTTFEVNDKEQLIPEFLFIWFLNPEMDRFGWFLSDGSVRSNLDWDRFAEIKIPVPNLERQQEIVDIYHAAGKRKKLVNRIWELQNNICPILIKGATEEGGR
jgi:type I restriction enzyme S subunit